jgi:hypothetical protein
MKVDTHCDIYVNDWMKMEHISNSSAQVLRENGNSLT